MINELYLKKETAEKIRKEFQVDKEFPSVTLFSFFEEKCYQKLQRQIAALYYHHELRHQVHSAARAELPPSARKIIFFPEFLEWLSRITGSTAGISSVSALRFQWKDYTLLSDHSDQYVEGPGRDIIFDFTDYWDEKAGGTVVYKDEMGNFLALPRGGNIFSIVQRKATVQRFVQYVNHYAGKMKRYLVVGRVR